MEAWSGGGTDQGLRVSTQSLLILPEIETMNPYKLIQRVHFFPKMLLCLLLLAISTGVSAQGAYTCENFPECSQLSGAKSWLDQQQQKFMCGQAGAYCVMSNGVEEGNNAICAEIGNLENSVGACQSAWQAYFSGGIPAVCGSNVAGQIASIKSNSSDMLQPSTTCSVPPPPPPPPPPGSQWCGPGFNGQVCGNSQQSCELLTSGIPCSNAPPPACMNPFGCC